MNQTAPERQGFSSARLKRIDALLQRWIDDRLLSGALAVVARRGEVVYEECFGAADVETHQPTRPDTIYRIYSMSKPITSVAVMMLYEEGRFQLGDPVSRFIPELADVKVFVNDHERADLERPITIHHLLTHTAGLAYDIHDASPVDVMYKEASLLQSTSLEEMIAKLARLPLVHQPGTMWRYSIAIDVLGYLVQVVSRMPFDQFLRERIFQPLGMVDTGFDVPAEKIDRLATLYGSGLWIMDKGRQGEYVQPFGLPSGGGGLVSTAADYLRFCQMMLNGGELDGVRLLGRKTVEFMTQNHLKPELMPPSFPDNVMYGHGFGLGFSVITDPAQAQMLVSTGTYAWGGLASTLFWIDPAEALIAIMMTQLIAIDRQNKPATIPDLDRDMRTAVCQALVD